MSTRNITLADSEIFCSLCADHRFNELIKTFNVSCVDHDDFASDSYESFIKTFSIILETDEESIKNVIFNKSVEEPFKSLLKFEFGENLIHVFDDERIVANIAWISALSEEFKREIVVISDFYTLTIAHLGKKVIIFKPSQIQVGASPLGCVVYGLNTYHPLRHTNVLDDIKNNVIYEKIFYNNQNANLINDDQPNHVEDEREIEFVETGAGGRTQIPVDDIGSPAEEQFMSNERNQRNNANQISSTINSFLNEHFTRSSIEDITLDAYCSNTKLNFESSAINSETLSVTRTHDIDGLFGYFDMKDFGDIIKSPVNFLIYPSLVDPRTRKNIEKFVSPVNGNFHFCIKIGVIDNPFGSIDIIVLIDSSLFITNDKLKLIAEECSSFSRSLPCTSDESHYSTCRSIGVRTSHRATMRASTSSHGRQECENYTPNLATCYVYHFRQILYQKLETQRRRVNFKIFFKCVGSKSRTFTESLKDCIEPLRSFESAIDFKLIDTRNIWVDYCITSSPESSQGPVRIFYFYFF